MSLLSPSSLYLGIEHKYLIVDKAIAGSACVISIFGALLVTFSFLYDMSETSIKWKELYYKICCGYKIKERKSKGKLV